MAGGFPVGFQQAPVRDFVTPSSSDGIAVQSGNSSSKGNWVELIASTASHASMLHVSISRPAETVGRALFDIAIGAAGSEIILIADILHHSSGDDGGYHSYTFPVSIPAGSRISARCAANSTTTSRKVSLMCMPDAIGSFAPAGNIDTYGASTTNLYGVTIDPGGSANSKGSYAQIASSTTRNYRGFVLGFSVGATTTGSSSLPAMCVDVAVGASGSEKVIVADMQLYSPTPNNTTPVWYCWHNNLFLIPIPAGSRIAARCQSNVTGSGFRTASLAFYGVP